MISYWRALRRRILTPSITSTRVDVRGFHEKDAASRELLETVGESFLVGYSHAAESASPDVATGQLENVPRRFRGFAYEGAAMAFAIRDALPFGRHDNVARFLAGRGDDHVYMAYVGVGWAMARLPRFRWSKLTAPDPLLRWLALDGFGFHQAYFRTERYVHDQFQEPEFPWPGGSFQWYANRAIDQGIGRAMWFVGGTDADLVASMIEKFPEHRRPDLYSGTGLAATYAGGADEAELRALVERAGAHRPQLAQGCAFAAAARARAGLVVPHNEVATRVFCGMDTARAAELSDRRRPPATVRSDLPLYEIWRQSVAKDFVSTERS